jgi:hypothetical protein
MKRAGETLGLSSDGQKLSSLLKELQEQKILVKRLDTETHDYKCYLMDKFVEQIFAEIDKVSSASNDLSDEDILRVVANQKLLGFYAGSLGLKQDTSLKFELLAVLSKHTSRVPTSSRFSRLGGVLRDNERF